MNDRKEILQGTLDLMVLQTLQSMGSMHGYGIAQRLQQISEDVLYLNQGTIYPALLRLEQKGLITSDWGVSESNRRARYYAITKAGRRQLTVETENWRVLSAIVNRVLEA